MIMSKPNLTDHSFVTFLELCMGIGYVERRCDRQWSTSLESSEIFNDCGINQQFLWKCLLDLDCKWKIVISVRLAESLPDDLSPDE